MTMATKKHADDGGDKRPGPGQPDKDRRVTQVANKIGRDAKSGQFIPVKEAQKRPSTTVIETIKRPGKPIPKKK